jgi:hypothetical protein
MSSRESISPGAGPATPPRIILGSGRSGTTWVLDCLAEANGLRPVFEPLHPKESAVGSQFAYQVLTASDSADEFAKYLVDIAEGKIHSRWIDYRGPKGLVFPRPRVFRNYRSARRWLSGWRKYRKRKRSLKSATRRNATLIKFIRGNLMAGWFARKLGWRTAFVVRHPCSVVESQLRLGKVWDPTSVLDGYRNNARLHELTDGRYLELLHKNLSRVEALTLNWIIENQSPIERSNVDQYKVIFYEDLVDRGESSWPVLCDSLDLPQIPSEDMLRRPSQQSAQAVKSDNEQFRLPSWQKRLAPEQLKQVQTVLDVSEFTLYSVESGNAAV